MAKVAVDVRAKRENNQGDQQEDVAITNLDQGDQDDGNVAGEAGGQVYEDTDDDKGRNEDQKR